MVYPQSCIQATSCDAGDTGNGAYILLSGSQPKKNLFGSNSARDTVIFSAMWDLVSTYASTLRFRQVSFSLATLTAHVRRRSPTTKH